MLASRLSIQSEGVSIWYYQVAAHLLAEGCPAHRNLWSYCLSVVRQRRGLKHREGPGSPAAWSAKHAHSVGHIQIESGAPSLHRDPRDTSPANLARPRRYGGFRFL